MKIKEEIRKILENYSEPIRRGNVIYGEERLSRFAVEALTEELTNLFKNYIYSLIPNKKDEINSSFSNRNLTFVDGWNYCRQEILKKIEEDFCITKIDKG